LEKVGIVFGCFIPLHDGHKRLINDAFRENDKVIIAVCGYDDDRGKDFIPFSDRYELMCKKYEYDDNIYVVKVDDSKIGLTGLFDEESWVKWSDELFLRYFKKYGLFGREVAQYTWYTGELDYVTKLSKIFENDNFKYYGRHTINISGTKIRHDYDFYKHMVDDDFRKYLEREKE
jgi:NadR type nicotinamide-nucleotide adenylyltransferase